MCSSIRALYREDFGHEQLICSARLRKFGFESQALLFVRLGMQSSRFGLALWPLSWFAWNDIGRRRVGPRNALVAFVGSAKQLPDDSPLAGLRLPDDQVRA